MCIGPISAHNSEAYCNNQYIATSTVLNQGGLTEKSDGLQALTCIPEKMYSRCTDAIV